MREGQDVVSEKAGQGYDTVEIDHSPAGLDSYTLGPNLEKLIVQEPTFYGLGGCELTGNDLDNVITATTTADKLVGAGGNDTLYGGPIGENASEDTGAEDFFGGKGNDTIYGFGGDDTMSGQAGNDTMYGDAGNDRMVGGTGLDRLSGGGNEDIYDYNMLTDSKPGGSRDVVLDFEGVGTAGGDHIDLSTIDAVGGGTNNTFDFIGTNAFTGPGQVRVSPSGLDTLIQANTSGAAGTELEIKVSDGGDGRSSGPRATSSCSQGEGAAPAESPAAPLRPSVTGSRAETLAFSTRRVPRQPRHTWRRWGWRRRGRRRTSRR